MNPRPKIPRTSLDIAYEAALEAVRENARRAARQAPGQALRSIGETKVAIRLRDAPRDAAGHYAPTYQVVISVGRLRHKLTLRPPRGATNPASPVAFDAVANMAISYALRGRANLAHAIKAATEKALRKDTTYEVKRL